jgi:hypothetical protein
LSAMQRPLLLRAWIDAAQASGATLPPASADALHLSGLALDVPVPAPLL